MKNQLLPMADKLLLRKRALIETIIDQLKNISQNIAVRSILWLISLRIDCLLPPTEKTSAK